jgi:predicted DNA-binding ribbon-helix-helix protein
MTGAPIRVVKHSLVIAGHRTSVSLEEPFWTELKSFAVERGLSMAALVAEIDSARNGANLSSAIRVALLERARAKAQ